MYHTNRNDMIETDDIQDIHHAHITEEDGHKILCLKATLDPRKQYHQSAECYVHLTNGVNHRTFGPFTHAQPLQSLAPTKTPEEPSEELPVADEQADEESVKTSTRKKGR